MSHFIKELIATFIWYVFVFVYLLIYLLSQLFISLFLILAVLILHTYIFSFLFKYIYLCKYQVSRSPEHHMWNHLQASESQETFIHCILFCPECIWRRSLHHHTWHHHIWHHCDVTLTHWYRKALKRPESIECISYWRGGKHLLSTCRDASNDITAHLMTSQII